MINKIDYFKILDTYDKTVSKRVKNKKSLVKMEMNKISYISNIYNLLVNDKYNFYKYNVFMIKEHKYRIIMSSNIYDKVINHYFTNYFLYKKLEPYLI